MGLFIVTSDGLYKYDLQQQQLNTLFSGFNFQKLKYDVLNHHIYIISNNQLWIYDINSGNYEVYSHTASLKEILVYYNK